MDFKKFGWMLIILGGSLGVVAAYHAMIPYINRWDDFKVISDATMAGYRTREYIEMKAERATDAQRVFGFGWAGAVTVFLGLALIFSSKKSSSTKSPASFAQSEKTYWICGKCNETTETAKNTCWSWRRSTPQQLVQLILDALKPLPHIITGQANIVPGQHIGLGGCVVKDASQHGISKP
jgi:hypothetical protein